MSDHPSFSELYLDAQRSFAALAASFTPNDWATPVPCCPGWTVRDVLSHVVGLTDDVLAGNVDGAASEPWTAAQVERLREAPVAELFARWDAQVGPAGALFDAIGEARPPFDCCTHEHDVRHAVGRPGNRDSIVVTAGGASVRRGVTVPDGLSDFEVFRSRLGRRSLAQVRAYAWAEPPDDAQLTGWFIFGPSLVDIDE
jgi:uncharacterized protein (TIGR03083 family)